MRIGIDARMLNASGIGRYITNLLKNLQEIDQENEYIIFLLKKDINQFKASKNFKLVEADFLWYSLEEQIKFPGILKKYRLDLVHFPHFNTPVFYNGRFIVTIHDLTHLDFKMNRASTHNRIYYEFKHQAHKMVILSAVKRSTRIITVSEYVKKQLIKTYNLKPTKIEVTYEAVDENIVSLAKKLPLGKQRAILDRFNIHQPFLFYVGNAHPHKNVEGLIQAFLKVRQSYQDLQLVLSGREDFFWKRIKKKFDQVEGIIITGFVDDSELVALYKNAQSFIFPSLSEGFGIPLLEAMACSCPIVASCLTALPEIAGNAALYFDPGKAGDLEEKIIQILTDENLRKELIKKGTKRYKNFSWKKLTQQTLRIYQEP